MHTSRSYVYIQSEPGLHTVGFYKPDGQWVPESDHEDKEEAAKRVAYLNGGNVNQGGGLLGLLDNFLRDEDRVLTVFACGLPQDHERTLQFYLRKR